MIPVDPRDVYKHPNRRVVRLCEAGEEEMEQAIEMLSFRDGTSRIFPRTDGECSDVANDYDSTSKAQSPAQFLKAECNYFRTVLAPMARAGRGLRALSAEP